MNTDFWFALISTVLAVGGAIWGAGVVVTKQMVATERRFNSLEDRISENESALKQSRQAYQSQFDLLNYKIDTTLEYRINANTNLIEHRSRRFEDAIKTLSGALQRVSDGRYVPRGAHDWPTSGSSDMKRYPQES